MKPRPLIKCRQCGSTWIHVYETATAYYLYVVDECQVSGPELQPPDGDDVMARHYAACRKCNLHWNIQRATFQRIIDASQAQGAKR